MAMTADDPAAPVSDNTDPAIDEGNDPIIAMVNERLAAIEAAVPQDLTKVTPNDLPIGLEFLIAASLQGDEGEPPAPANGTIPHNTPAASAPGVDVVRATSTRSSTTKYPPVPSPSTSIRRPARSLWWRSRPILHQSASLMALAASR